MDLMWDHTKSVGSPQSLVNAGLTFGDQVCVLGQAYLYEQALDCSAQEQNNDIHSESEGSLHLPFVEEGTFSMNTPPTGMEEKIPTCSASV